MKGNRKQGDTDEGGEMKQSCYNIDKKHFLQALAKYRRFQKLSTLKKKEKKMLEEKHGATRS